MDSGKLQILQVKIELECVGSSCFGIYTNLSFCISSLRERKKQWLISGDGCKVKITNTMIHHTLTEDSQQIGRRTMFVTLTSIKSGKIRKLVWFIWIGGAETKTLGNISKWERGMESSHQCLASTMNQSTLLLKSRINIGPI